MENKSSFNDPDFDQSASSPRNKTIARKFFDQLSPTSALLVGLIGGVMTLCTIGFIILLSWYLKGGIKVAASNDSAPIPVVSQPTPSAPPPAPPAPAPSGTVPPVTNADHIRGDKNAQLTWIEYSDTECPFCKRFHPTMLRMMQEYQGKIRWVYRHFPLSFHANAQKEAEATECANELGGTNAFWAYTDKIFERTTSNGTGFALDQLGPLAKELGLNQQKFQSCLDSGKYTARVQQDEAGGQGAGVNGTPGSFLIGKDGKAQLISGALPYEQIKAAIDAQFR